MISLKDRAKELSDCRGGTIFKFDGYGLEKLASPEEDDYFTSVVKYMNADKLIEHSWNTNAENVHYFNEYEIKEKIVDSRENIILVFNR